MKTETITLEDELKEIEKTYNGMDMEQKENYYNYMLTLYSIKEETLHSKIAILMFLVAASEDIKIIMCPEITGEFNFKEKIDFDNDKSIKNVKAFYNQALEDLEGYINQS